MSMRVSTIVIILVVLVGGYYVAKKKGYIGKVEKAMEDSFGSHYATANKHYLAEKYEDAIKEYRAAVKKDPKHENAFDAMARVGDCYARLDDYDKAVAAYRETLKRYPGAKRENEIKTRIAKINALSGK